MIQASRCSNQWGVYLGKGPKPDLLSTIQNGLGGRVTIEYKSSSFYKYSDASGGHRSNPLMPFITQTVHRVWRDDGRATANSVAEVRYYYEGGLYDGDTREFRGFAHVETRAEEVSGSAGSKVRPVTLTRFHQDYQLKGRVDLVKAYNIPILAGENDLARLVASTDSPLSATEHSYVEPDPADDKLFHDPNNNVVYSSAVSGVQLSHLIQTDSITYDSDPATWKVRRVEFIYDDGYGNVITERKVSQS